MNQEERLFVLDGMYNAQNRREEVDIVGNIDCQCPLWSDRVPIVCILDSCGQSNTILIRDSIVVSP